MNTTENFPWIPFYTKFADALVPYRRKRKELIKKLRNIYYIGNADVLTGDPYPEDIDPFTVFGLFNKSFTNVLRQEIIRALMTKFGISGQFPEEFLGIPVITSLPTSKTFYAPNGKRGEDDIENLWEVFDAALELASHDTPQRRDRFCAAFDQALTQKQVKWNLTIGLFWVRPFTFLSLDRCNRRYLEEHWAQFPILEKVPAAIFKSVPNGSTYLSLCDAFKELFSSGHSAYSSFPELSRKAWLSDKEQEPPKTETSQAVHQTPKSPDTPRIAKDASYTKEDFLNDTFLEADKYDELAETLAHKKNLILQGPPGVGKTYIARRLASALAGEDDPERIRLIQFHQNTSYEDIIMGFRPAGDGFTLRKGVFYQFCKQAEADPQHDYYLIIDEINRGNTSKIFGEMFMLLEKDKRGKEYEVPLLYNDEPFFIPENLYIIGTMNTADRSLAMLDYALRRRFAFYDLKPAFETRKFSDYSKNLDSEELNALLETLKELNEKIATDPTLGEGFCLGHSYFCKFTPDDLTRAKLRTIVDHELIPLLGEYWFDDRKKAGDWAGKLRAAL
ncbi:MAG: AAA domain-containing protein [Desulfovibrio sp.]|nr:AAA domain-containing protein [Desulfovibrio sp.]